ncbi:SET-domain-containing protein [Mycena chlorophos]|uniref:SET-domain-containing protein n=1 Tax=Mycena chlorophos TaxID=658473 RepID=A0A8H6VTE7_MYCCL|nr:SET-domain-containing protein [Mycena chlorophos]
MPVVSPSAACLSVLSRSQLRPLSTGRIATTLFTIRRGFLPLPKRVYSTETPLPTNLKILHNKLNDAVADITLPNGAVCTLRHLRLPRNATASEPSTACLVWGDTKEALDENEFELKPLLVPTESGMYRIGPSPVAGKGMFAARDIKRGETIVVERPFFLTPASQPPDAPQDWEEMQSWPWNTLQPMTIEASEFFVSEYLTEEERQQLFALDSTDGSLYQIMSQNAVLALAELPGRYSAPHKALCRDISRINHSCLPNVQFSWNAKSFAVAIHALRPIEKDEELFHAYGIGLTLQARSTRQEFLDNQYSFRCACPACSLPDDTSAIDDAERENIRDLFTNDLDLPELQAVADSEPRKIERDPAIERWLADPTLPDDYIVAQSTDILRRMEDVGIDVLEIRLLHYNRLYEAFEALGDSDGVKYWANRYLEFRDHPALDSDPELEEMKRALNKPERGKGWGARRR